MQWVTFSKKELVVSKPVIGGFKANELKPQIFIKADDLLGLGRLEWITTQPVAPVMQEGHPPVFFMLAISNGRIAQMDQIDRQTR